MTLMGSPRSSLRRRRRWRRGRRSFERSGRDRVSFVRGVGGDGGSPSTCNQYLMEHQKEDTNST